MARIDGYVRLVQKALPQSATPSVPVSDDHTDGTWTYRDIYDREIAINDDGVIYWRALDNIYEFQVSTQSDIYTIGATLSGSTAIFTRNDSATYSLDLSSLETQLTNVDYIAFNTTPTVVHSEGTMHWNDTTKTLEVDTENSGVRIEVGQQLYLRVNNQTGSQLDKGKIVYINGQQGQRPTVTLADYSSEATSSKTLGFVAATMSNGQNGYVLTYGILEGIDTNAYTPGTTLYLSTSGNWTSTKPDAPNHMVSVGKVINQSTTGSIYVSVQNGYELQELHNVLITGATAGQILQYNGSLWVNATASGTPTLSQVLTEGWETGINDIALTIHPLSGDADGIVASSNNTDYAAFTFEERSAGFWSPIMKTMEGDRKNQLTVDTTKTQLFNSRVGGFINQNSTLTIDENSITLNSDDLATGDGTSIDLNTLGILVQSYNPTFEGIKYASDYSANFTNRSIVDKEYVDGAIAGSGETLQQTLSIGNTTGTHSIYISSSASKIQGYNGVSQHWYDASNFLGDYFQIENGTGTSASFIKLFDDASGAIHLANNNAWDLTSNDAGRTSIYMGGNTQILSENRDFSGNTFHTKTNTAVAPNGSTTETRDMINDTSAMVSTYTDGAGTETYTLLQSYHNGGLKAGQIYVYKDRVNLKAEDNGVSFTNVELNYTDIVVSGTPSFGGMKYDRDYSPNYTNRSLVDKAYVDSVAGGGGSGITYSGQAEYLTFFDTNDSLSYTNMYYNSGRYTIGHGSGWVYDHYATFGVYSPYTTGPAIIGESSQFGGLFIASGAATGQTIGLQGQASGSTIQGNLGIYGNAVGTMSSNIGGYFAANDGTIYPGFSGFSNLGLDVVASSFYSTGAVGLTNSGINISVSGRVGDNNYIGKFSDGSEGVGKVLTCVSADGLARWVTPTGGGSASSFSTAITSSANLGYRRGTSKLYRLTRMIDSYNVSSGLINGESIWLHTFQCSPGEKINEIAFRIMTAGSAGLGLAECRVLIYRTKLNAAGEIVGGDIELDTGVQINTLTTGIKVVTGLNHTLSSNTYKDLWFIGIRNYQTGTLSVKTYSNTDTATLYADVASSGSTMFRDNAWYFTCAWNAAVPTLMPMTASTATGPNVLTPNDTVVTYMGISAA